MPMRADPSQGFRGVRRVAKSHNKRSVSNEQEELKPLRADPSQGFRGVRRVAKSHIKRSVSVSKSLEERMYLKMKVLIKLKSS